MPSPAHRSQKGKVELACVLRTKLRCFQFNDHVAAQLQVAEQEINDKFLATDIQPALPPDKRESRFQLKKEPDDMTRERLLDVTFVGIFCEVEEVENVRSAADGRGFRDQPASTKSPVHWLRWWLPEVGPARLSVSIQRASVCSLRPTNDWKDVAHAVSTLAVDQRSYPSSKTLSTLTPL